MEIRIYTKETRYSFIKKVKESLNGFQSSWFLARTFAIRDIKSQFRQSILGVFWVLVPVLMSAAVWIFLRQSGAISVSSTEMPYPLFVIIGTSIWSVLSECLNMTINSVNMNKAVLTKINFQKEALITLGAIKILFNIIIKLLLIIVLIIYYRINISYSIISFLPTFTILIFSFISLGILITPFGLLFTDVSRFIPIALQILMYLSPVVYNVPKSGILHQVMKWNPLTYFLEALRNSLTGGPINHSVFILGYFICALILFFVAIVVYRISMPIITERMSA